jgi:hypothetical protein
MGNNVCYDFGEVTKSKKEPLRINYDELLIQFVNCAAGDLFLWQLK